MAYYVQARKGKTVLQYGIRAETEAEANRMRDNFIKFGWTIIRILHV